MEKLILDRNDIEFVQTNQPDEYYTTFDMGKLEQQEIRLHNLDINQQALMNHIINTTKLGTIDVIIDLHNSAVVRFKAFLAKRDSMYISGIVDFIDYNKYHNTYYAYRRDLINKEQLIDQKDADAILDLLDVELVDLVIEVK